MLPATPTRETRTSWVEAISEDKQRRRLVIAVLLLLAAITAVLVRDYRASLASNNNNDETAVAYNEQPMPAPSPKPVLPAIESKLPVAPTQSTKAAPVHKPSSHAHLPSATWVRQPLPPRKCVPRLKFRHTSQHPRILC